MTTTTKPELTVTLTAPYKRIVFTWTDLAEKSFGITTFGVEEDELDRVIAARGHEGVTVDGFETEIA